MMHGVVLDVLSLYTSVNLLTHLKIQEIPDRHAESFNNLLTAILFWDDMYLPECQYLSILLDELQHDSLISDFQKLFVPLKSDIYTPFQSVTGMDEYTKNLVTDKYHEKDVENYHLRTRMYLQIVSKSENLSYIPNPLRLERIINESQTRKSISKMIDNAIIEHPKSRVTSFNTPLIIEYVKQIAGPLPREQLKFVLEQRKTKEMINLRKSLNKLELKVKPGSHSFDMILREEINEMVNICFNKNSIKRFSLTPTITTTGGIVIPFPLGFRISKKSFPTTFLLDLISFRTDTSNAVI